MYFITKICFLLFFSLKKSSIDGTVLENICTLKKSETLCSKYQCTSDVCSVDKKSCDTFLSSTKKLKKKESINRTNLIKTCRSKEYVSISSEICLNKDRCNEWTPNSYFFKLSIRFQKKECPCNSGELKYKCQNNYCTKNEQTCDIITRSSKNMLKITKRCL